MAILQTCWLQKTSRNNLDNFKICDAQIFMIDIFYGHIDVAIIIYINDMGVHPVIAFNDFQAKFGKGEIILKSCINLDFILAQCEAQNRVSTVIIQIETE